MNSGITYQQQETTLAVVLHAHLSMHGHQEGINNQKRDWRQHMKAEVQDRTILEQVAYALDEGGL